MPGQKTAQSKSANGSKPAPPRSIAEIEADIAATRESLVQNVGNLQVAVKQTVDPKRIVLVQVTRVRSIYIDEYGGVRPERVAVTVGVVVSIIVVRKLTRRMFRRGN
jgi:hypothetical protein